MNRAEYNAMRAEQKRARLSLSREVVKARRELRKQEADQRRQQRDEERRKAAQEGEKNAKVQANARALVMVLVAKHGDNISLSALQDLWTEKQLGKSLLRTAVDQLTATGELVENRNHDSSHTIIIPRGLAAG